MNRTVQALSLTLLLYLPLAAGIPIQSMTPSTLGIEYAGLASGQLLSDDSSHTSLMAHYFRLQYSPFRYMSFSLGMGSSRFALGSKSSPEFSGNSGFAGSAGVTLYLPRVHELMSLTTGVNSYFFSSSNEQANTLGQLLVPFAGLIVHLKPYVDLELGGMYHTLDGQSKVEKMVVSNYENRQKVRLYSSLTLHDPESGVYVSGGMSSSGDLSNSFKKGAPYQSSVWFQFGILLRQDRNFQKQSR